MRSARMLLATAAATAVLAITAPGAYADGDQWDHEDHGYSKEHDKDSSHDGPRGGVHTGGGALTSLNTEGDWGSERGGKPDAGGYDKEEATKDGQEKESWKGGSGNESWKDEQDKGSWKDEEEGAWKGDHDKPRGGMHTGGGALASPAVTAGGMAVLAVAGTGMYALRRRKTAGSVA
ncbi:MULTISPECIES: hypothetical protein [Streptomyces]|nr:MULTISPECIES: hypothetical protein [Streptomyces]KND40620.1 membrane protein [Streptomyces stelliscabiei]MDX2519162.1 hypothetical protein [Streptomyces stelliscabiei]MDX2554284.1 hypothetical protein [Streptomyces stelliscabiei]MDX2609961.1 hypothetical protein [Streptomyces stelliscabiei]MDX2638682.1 hypothetical protein [Streptomyces stelliscabiei]